MKIPLSQIDADPIWNVRLGDSDVSDLTISIQQEGLLNPLTTVPKGDRYRLIAGFRRLKAVKRLGWDAVECTVMEADEQQARRVNVMENLSRSDLNPLEEARGMRMLYPNSRTTIREVAEGLSKSGAWVSRRRYLLKLPRDVQERFANGELPIGKIYSVCKATDPNRAVNIITARTASKREYIPVQGQNRKTKAALRQMIICLMERGLQGLPTRLLAWAAGNVSEAEIMADIEGAT